MIARSLTTVLQRYAGAGPKLGADMFPAEALRKDLDALIRRNGKYFAVTFGILVIMLVLALLLLALNLTQPARAAAVLAASGVSIPFLLRMMLRMWETKTNSEALLALATTLDPKTLQSIVKVLSQPMIKDQKTS